MKQILQALTFHEDWGAFDSSTGNRVPSFYNRWHEPICGWEWYKAHYKTQLPEQSIEISFDDKKLATIEDWGYKKGMIKNIMLAERERHHEIYMKYGRLKCFVGCEDDPDLDTKLEWWGYKRKELVTA